MSSAIAGTERPDRWTHPLSADMTDRDVAWLLEQEPFCALNPERFAADASLHDILRHDARLVQLQPGEFVFREGQYGGTAFLVLSGNVRIFISRLLLPGSVTPSKSSTRDWLGALRRVLGGEPTKPVSPTPADARQPGRRRDAKVKNQPVALSYQGKGTHTRVFLQDVPGVLAEHATSAVGPGELFGEMAAVTRSPREFTAVAEGECLVLEIRWQGLRLLKQDPVFRKLLDERYRSEVLRTHLRETELFRFIPDAHLSQVVAAARLESFGDLEWYAAFRKRSQLESSARIDAEPIIAEEGSYVTGLWIIRNGFARLSSRQGAGHRTVAYLGKGQLFGLRELVHNRAAAPAPPLPYQESLRAIGYVDALCIPKPIVAEHILPFVRQSDLPVAIHSPRYQFGQPVIDAPLDTAEHHVETGLLEFLVEQRFINGQRTMVIDTQRCTRCDDCVRACAKTHGGSPVFVREGLQYGPLMFAHACMHCQDPVCMIGCPTGAIHRDHESGLVEINEQTCIGCKSCAESCPYDNIRMVPSVAAVEQASVDAASQQPLLTASKCDLCSSAGGSPVCQAACPHDALVRLDMSDLGRLSDWMHRRAA